MCILMGPNPGSEIHGAGHDAQIFCFRFATSVMFI